MPCWKVNIPLPRSSSLRNPTFQRLHAKSTLTVNNHIGLTVDLLLCFFVSVRVCFAMYVWKLSKPQTKLTVFGKPLTQNLLERKNLVRTLPTNLMYCRQRSTGHASINTAFRNQGRNSDDTEVNKTSYILQQGCISHMIFTTRWFFRFIPPFLTELKHKTFPNFYFNSQMEE